MDRATTEEVRNIISLLTDGRAVMAALAITFVIELMLRYNIYLVPGTLLSLLLLGIPSLAEALLWLTAFGISVGVAYYSKMDGAGSAKAFASAVFMMVRFNFPRQLLYLAGLLLWGVGNMPGGWYAASGAKNILIFALILLGINLALACVFAAAGIAMAKLRGK